MKTQTRFEINPLFLIEYLKYLETEILHSQDPIHIGTKLRNRLLKASILLLLGNKQVSVAHLKILIESITKDVHGLVLKDICPDDRQNFASLEKVMQPRVIESLKKHIFDSDATVACIQICYYVKLSPIDRIFRIYYSVFFLRAWKKWLIKKNYDLDKHFITSNAFECIEINANCLLSLVVKLRESRKAFLFKPYLFDSQMCEKTFRQLRTMTSMNQTKINFSMNEMMHMIERVELQSKIVYNKLANTGIIFPRIKIDDTSSLSCETESSTEFTMPSNAEIVKTVENAKNTAINDINIFGINAYELEIEHCDVVTRNLSTEDDDND